MLPVYIAVGGMLGALARYFVSGLIQDGHYFPLGTLGVNFSGSFLIGFFMFSSDYFGLFSQETRALIAIGFLGSFTTMSTFGYESLRLLQEGNVLYFLLNIFTNVAGCLFAVYLGRALAIVLWRFLI